MLGQSVNKGWQAVAEPGPGAAPGARTVDLGRPQLVDGFANGWQVSAADLHALGGSSFTVELTWTPQREIWAALAVSAATLILCLVIAFLPLPRPSLGAGRTCPADCAGRRGPSRPNGPRCPSMPPSWRSPAPRHPRTNASGAGCASRGRC